MPASTWLAIGVLGIAASAAAQTPRALDRDAIVKTMNQGPRLGPMNLCADLTGQFGARVRIRVAADGTVEAADVATTDRAFGKCVADKILAVQFPQTRSGGTFGYEYGFRGVYPNVVARPIAAADVGPDPCEPVGALVAQAMAERSSKALAIYDEALALHTKLPACKGDRDRVVQRALTRACKLGDKAKAVAYARQTVEVWLEPMYACRDAKIALPTNRATGSLHVAHGRGSEWYEVAIDGENYGSPPINAGHLRAGKHEVAIWDSRTKTTKTASVSVVADDHVHLDETLKRTR